MPLRKYASFEIDCNTPLGQSRHERKWYLASEVDALCAQLREEVEQCETSMLKQADIFDAENTRLEAELLALHEAHETLQAERRNHNILLLAMSGHLDKVTTERAYDGVEAVRLKLESLDAEVSSLQQERDALPFANGMPAWSLFHRLWSKAVGTADYVKADWLALEAAILKTRAAASRPPEGT